MAARGHAASLVLMVLCTAAPPAGAQQTEATPPAAAPGAPPPAVPFLFIDQDRLLTGSAAGQDLMAEEEAARDRLRTQARELDRRFEAEERQLTELRPTLDAAEFRRRADEFDARVVEARAAQDARSEALVQEIERRRRQFYSRIGPLLVAMLSRYRAYAIFDESSVLLADQSLDVTDAVIAEIDALQADGGAAEAAPEPAVD